MASKRVTRWSFGRGGATLGAASLFVDYRTERIRLTSTVPRTRNTIAVENTTL
jgi:hypothetical protein